MRTLASALVLVLSATAWGASTKASSEGTGDDGVKHPASHAFDGLLATGWAEGDMGDGAGAWIEIRFDRPVDVSSISIWPGWLGGANRELREFGRPRAVTLSFDVAGGDPVEKREVILDPGADGPLRHDVVIDAPAAKSVRISLEEVYAGGIYSDTYIAEVAFNLVAGEPHSQVVEIGEWLESDPGMEVANKHRDEAVALFEAIQAEQFGDRDSLRQLMDWAADGAPYLRDRVASRVSAGFRLNALQPDKTSLEALLKLKDSNAIPAIERAALRSTGALQDDLLRRAKLFNAYQDLIGGGARNVAPWGQTGFSKGALKSLGEPLDIVINADGGVFVADVANHRVQRFDIDSGVSEKVWGAPEPGLTDVWFYKKRDHYAAGSEPSVKDGAFVHPVDLAIVPGKEGDSLLVLDIGVMDSKKAGSKGRVTLIGPGGGVEHTQMLPFEDPLSPGVGGEGHVMFTKKQVIVVWGNQGVSYDLDSWTELTRFDIEDGVPNGAVAFKTGKFGLIFGEQLVLYSTDGFRHGDLMLGALGRGFEAWGVTEDDRGKLWAVLDTGEVIKFKKPGKVDFRFELGEYSVEVPRIAVVDDHVFITSGDTILRGDALELHAAQQAGEQRDTLDLGDDL